MKKWKRNTEAAHEARRKQAAKAKAALRVPRGFRDIDDFLIAVRERVQAMPYGASSRAATEIGVSSSTLTKWIGKNEETRNYPSAEKLRELVLWYDREKARGDGKLPKVMPKAQPSAVAIRSVGSRPLNVMRISAALQARLRRTATKRGVAPLLLVEQILDRTLDKS